MCCDDEVVLDLPPAVIEALARYRRLRDEQGFGWGEEQLPELFRWARFARLGPVFAELSAGGDWAGAVRAAVGERVPAGLVLVSVGAGGRLSARTGPPRPVIAGSTAQVDVVLDSADERDRVVEVNGVAVPVAAGGAGLRVLDLDAAAPVITLSCGGSLLEVTDAVVPTAAATLRLSSPHGARWSVSDPTGGAWFAADAPAKWDAADRPFFHTDPGTVELAVPAGPLHVVAARAWSSSASSRPCTPARARPSTSSTGRSAGSTRPPTAGSAPTCTCT